VYIIFSKLSLEHCKYFAQLCPSTHTLHEKLTFYLNPIFQDLVKANKRQVQKSQHEIQREIFSLERQEKETLAEIKKLAAKGQVRNSHLSPFKGPLHGYMILSNRFY
jgi:hypothetical protein